ncbi:hypothetical protein V6N11_023893 [Hibiscus sabdariffa]|uniref:Uncharacterized protein n=1 Tax=Hibiscus sabdariffa TaxID=183260 RepID=A0ABR2TNL3_9ROSI
MGTADTVDMKVAEDTVDVKDTEDTVDMKVAEDTVDVKDAEDMVDMKVAEDTVDVKDAEDMVDVKVTVVDAEGMEEAVPMAAVVRIITEEVAKGAALMLGRLWMLKLTTKCSVFRIAYIGCGGHHVEVYGGGRAYGSCRSDYYGGAALMQARPLMLPILTIRCRITSTPQF